MKKIPISKPYITNEEIREVIKVLKSGFLSLGPKLPEFEKNFADFIGTKYAAAVSNGTAGLHLCIKACGIKDNDEVITTPFSFISSANCILFERANPVFVDIDPETYNIDPSKIEKKITKKTKAILLVHIFGQSCDMESIMRIARKHKLIVIEDACESLGARYKGKIVGSFGKMAVFAFYPNKQMTTGEGGIIVTNDKKTYQLCKSLRNQGRSDNMQWLLHERLGYNYRLDEISCTLGIVQLKKIKSLIRERQEICNEYNKQLKNVPEVQIPLTAKNNIHTWFVYTIRLKKNINRNKVIKEMAKKGIACKAYFDIPIHLQPFYKKQYEYKKGDFPVCEDVCNSVITLPLYIGLTKKDIIRICNILKSVIKKYD